MDPSLTSKYSPINIGLANDVIARRDNSRAIYREEGLVVSDYIAGVHHYRKDPHRQGYYYYYFIYEAE